MITLRFFQDNQPLFALDTELLPDFKSAVSIKGKLYTIIQVLFVYDAKASYLRLDVEEQESKD
jgi:hypothetical protein